ncbi:MAG: SGNH/GDSL hydrolase family protein [Gammaproteobacteria bacterium]|nr:SGNH/GDSL hydrolase family protein [Gammaproteobacteria bacterium]
MGRSGPGSGKTILLVGIVVVSVFLNIVFFHYGKRFYREHALVRLDPLGLSYFSSEDGVVPAHRQHTVVLYGDSRIVDWSVPKVAGTVFVNRGVHSQTTAQLFHRYAAHVVPLQPDVVVVQAGVNDLKALAVFPELYSFLVAQCIGNINRIVDTATRHHAQVIITTIFPVGRPPWYKKPFWSPAIARAVREVNEHIRSLQRTDVMVLDAWTLLADEHGLLQDRFAPDELHLNAAGYDELNRGMVKLLMPGESRP